MNIAIVGLGNIGSYFFNYLKNNKNALFSKTNTTPNILYISAKSLNKKRKFKIPKKYLVVSKPNSSRSGIS